MDKDYKAERKQIRGHMGKDEAKPPLFQEFERKTILARKPVKEPPPAPAPLAPTPPAPTLFAPTPPALALAGQKSKSNPPDRQERPALAAKDPECQASNLDISPEKV